MGFWPTLSLEDRYLNVSAALIPKISRISAAFVRRIGCAPEPLGSNSTAKST
jgi:hypothetical protein